MGNRIAKFEGQDRWVVYQSVTDALYVPIFFDELSAELYAYHYGVISINDPDWRNEGNVGSDVSHFIKLSYGGADDFAEGDVYLDECATAGTARGLAFIDELHSAFLEWRKDQTIAPPQRTEHQGAE